MTLPHASLPLLRSLVTRVNVSRRAPPLVGGIDSVVTILPLASSLSSSSRSVLSSSSSASTCPTGKTDATAANTKSLPSRHIPVMRDEVLRFWLPDKAGGASAPPTKQTVHLIDGTLGLGGHTSAAILEYASSSSHLHALRVLGMDRDKSALSKARRRIENEPSSSSSTTALAECVSYHHGSFADLSAELLARYSFPCDNGGVDGILVDLGMNSDQIDDDERGFTFRKRGPLDMRFDNRGGIHGCVRAEEIVNTWSASKLQRIFEEYANEPYAKVIAAGILRWREEGRGGLRSTLELRYIIEEVVEEMVFKLVSSSMAHTGKDDNDKDRENTISNTQDRRNEFRKYRAIWRSPLPSGHPLSKPKRDKLLFKYEERKPRHTNHIMRCFQALRIASNNELRHIDRLFDLMMLPPLAPPSSSASLESEMSSSSLSTQACPLAVGGRLVAIAFHPGEDSLIQTGMARLVATGRFQLLTPEEDGLRPTVQEVKSNGRSRTARLRAVERVC